MGSLMRFDDLSVAKLSVHLFISSSDYRESCVGEGGFVSMLYRRLGFL